MIKKTLVIAAVLFLLWSLMLHLLPAELETGQTMRANNLIRAETYLYETEVSAEDVVLVGSSLSEKISIDKVNDHLVHNLGFGGQSALDGLDLILASSELPRFVFVETNILQPGTNNPLGVGGENPIVNWALRWIPAFRHRHQPVGVLKGLMLPSEVSEAIATPPTLQDRPLNAQSLALKVEEYAKPPEEAVLAKSMEVLRQRIEKLESLGVHIAFYETPVAPVLCDAPKAAALRKAYRTTFSVTDYSYVDQPDCEAFQTTDGHHLGDKSISLYSVWLREELDALLREL